MKMLREQIKAIHAKYFDKEFHEYRGQLCPAMIMDLKCKFFDLLEFNPAAGYIGEWYVPDTHDSARQDITIIRHADKLIQTCSLRENTPAMEF